MSIRAVEEVYRYNRWAYDRVAAVAGALDEAGLDRPFEVGPGTLRETLKHLYGAERIWFERIGGTGAESLPPSKPMHDLKEVLAAMHRLHDARQAWFASLPESEADRPVDYSTSDGRSFTSRLQDILLHVCNHGVHHRAQAAMMLRELGRPLTNLDYLFMRIERPTIRLADADTSKRLRDAGQKVGERLDPAPAFDGPRLRRFFEYDHWANEQLFAVADELDDAAIDRSFDFGLKSLRRTLLHIRDAGQNWLENWTQGSTPGFRALPKETPLAALRDLERDTHEKRRAFLESLDDAALHREVLAQPVEGIRLYFRLGEVVLQVALHGTHHRAQALNMLRRLGAATPALDYIFWTRG